MYFGKKSIVCLFFSKITSKQSTILEITGKQSTIFRFVFFKNKLSSWTGLWNWFHSPFSLYEHSIVYWFDTWKGWFGCYWACQLDFLKGRKKCIKEHFPTKYFFSFFQYLNCIRCSWYIICYVGHKHKKSCFHMRWNWNFSRGYPLSSKIYLGLGNLVVIGF